MHHRLFAQILFLPLLFMLKVGGYSSLVFFSMMLVHMVPVVSLDIASPSNCLQNEFHHSREEKIIHSFLQLQEGQWYFAL